jgi:hypothetical protein
MLNFCSELLERAIFAFSSPISFVTRDQFNKYCQTVFFRTEDYPTSTAVIVHGILEEIFQEFKWSEKDPALRQQYSDWAQLCCTNLEISISNLDLLLQPTMESAQALLFAVSIFFSLRCLRYTTNYSSGSILYGNRAGFGKFSSSSLRSLHDSIISY